MSYWGSPVIKCRTCLAFGLAASLSLTSSAGAAPKQDRFGYLVDGSNRIVNIEDNHGLITPEDNTKIARIACETLTRLSTDPDFRDALDRRKDARAAAERLVYDLKEFQATFLPRETELMRSQGLHPSTIDYTLALASKARSWTKVYMVPSKAIISTVSNARDAACKLETGAVSDLQRTQVTNRFFGIVLIGVDLAAAPAIIAATGVTGVAVAVGVSAAASLAEASWNIGYTIGWGEK